VNSQPVIPAKAGIQPGDIRTGGRDTGRRRREG
jgi:hypothetical protein